MFIPHTLFFIALILLFQLNTSNQVAVHVELVFFFIKGAFQQLHIKVSSLMTESCQTQPSKTLV